MPHLDGVIVDEAGQISLGSISLVLRCLSNQGRIVVAGDSEQLSPILSAQYPLLKAHALFGSVLDCLMLPRASPLKEHPSSFDESQGAIPTAPPDAIIQLTENFRYESFRLTIHSIDACPRLNPDLGEFVSIIYARKFKPQKIQAWQLANALGEVARLKTDDLNLNAEIFGHVQKFFTALSEVMMDKKSTGKNVLIAPELQTPIPTDVRVSGTSTTIHRPISLSLIRLRTYPLNISYESHVQVEAAIAATLVTVLRKCSPDDDIFVATPHRIQREAVKSALRKITQHEGLENAFGMLNVNGDDMLGDQKVTVDTIERLQGEHYLFVYFVLSSTCTRI